MYLVVNLAGPYRFERQSVTDLGQSSVSLFAGIENFQFPWRTPSATCGRSSQGIAALAGYSPHIRIKGLRVQFLQGVEYRPIMYPSPGKHQVKLPSSRLSITARILSASPWLMRSIARSPSNRRCFE